MSHLSNTASSVYVPCILYRKTDNEYMMNTVIPPDVVVPNGHQELYRPIDNKNTDTSKSVTIMLLLEYYDLLCDVLLYE